MTSFAVSSSSESSSSDDDYEQHEIHGERYRGLTIVDEQTYPAVNTPYQTMSMMRADAREYDRAMRQYDGMQQAHECSCPRCEGASSAADIKATINSIMQRNGLDADVALDTEQATRQRYEGAATSPSEVGVESITSEFAPGQRRIPSWWTPDGYFEPLDEDNELWIADDGDGSASHSNEGERVTRTDIDDLD